MVVIECSDNDLRQVESFNVYVVIAFVDKTCFLLIHKELDGVRIEKNSKAIKIISIKSVIHQLA